ncbi:MAG: drug/metabolite transporter (DMT)-like permease [Ilumatobacter sp.]
MGLIYGALTSLSIGLSDLFGRRVVNARGPVVTGAALQFVAFLTSLVAVVIVSSRFIVGDVLIGLASGIGIGIGLWGYFSGLERSSSAIVAPIVATLSAIIPYAYAVMRGASPAGLAVLGAAVALIGLVIITLGGGRTEAMAAGLKWGVISGFGYGFGLSIVIETTSDSGAWPSAGQRLAACFLMGALATKLRIDPRPPAGLRVSAIAAGITAGLSTVFFLFGVQADATSAVVMASLFPAVSVVVGRFVYGDEVMPRQIAGIGIVLLGVVGVSIA